MAPGCRSALEPHPQGVLLGFSRPSGTPAGTSGRRRFRRGVAMPTAWASATEGSARRATLAVRTVFSCVASRNRERTSRPRTKPSSPPSRPNPLGENQSLSSPPLEPRGLLLSVMRQKVGKERSQGDYHPLGHPPLLPSLAKPSCGPPPAVLCKASSNLRVPSGTSPRPGWRRRARPTGPQLLYLHPTPGPGPKNVFAPRSLTARLGDSFYFAKCKIVESLLRRGARTHRVFYWPAGCKHLRLPSNCAAP